MQKDKEDGVLKPADEMFFTQAKGYHSDPCNPRQLNKRFFSAVVILVFILVMLAVDHTFL